jgi:hypothetical protein
VTVYVANLDRVSQANFVEVIPVAPGMLYALNDNSERNGAQSPVTAGKALHLYVTGLRQANAPLYVKLHDLWMEAAAESSGQSGIDIVRITVPETFPTMYTAVMVCGQATGYEGVCSYPKDVWIKAVE